MPSTITAANSRVASFARIAPMSFSGVNSTFGVRLKGDEIAGLSVTATAPDVRPWKAFEMASALRPARVERRQFQGVLVGLGPRVAEEKAVVVVTRDAAQSLRQLSR